jgi:hypothetical protein
VYSPSGLVPLGNPNGDTGKPWGTRRTVAASDVDLCAYAEGNRDGAMVVAKRKRAGLMMPASVRVVPVLTVALERFVPPSPHSSG